MNLGKITVRLLSRLNLIPEGHCIVPRNFNEYGWAGWLPLANLITLPQISYCVSKDYSVAQTIAYLEEQNGMDLFWDFSNIPSFTSEYEENQYKLFFAREISIKNRLERNGYAYPSNMSEVVDLFTSLDFVHKYEDEDGTHKIDLLIRPIPKASTILKVQ